MSNEEQVNGITVEKVKEWLRSIAAEAEDTDHEEAHVYEDAMREKVLEAIASGCPNASELAKEALKSSEIEFERWYA